MQLDALTEDYIKILNSFSYREDMLIDIFKKRDEINNSILSMGFRLDTINNKTAVLQAFRKDLKFIEEGIRGSWKDDITNDDSHLYYHEIQKRINIILDKKQYHEQRKNYFIQTA